MGFKISTIGRINFKNVWGGGERWTQVQSGEKIRTRWENEAGEGGMGGEGGKEKNWGINSKGRF